MRGDTRLSYKKIKRRLGLKNVSLAAPERVKQLTGSEVGQVALVNFGLKTIVDERVTQVETIYGGCGKYPTPGGKKRPGRSRCSPG